MKAQTREISGAGKFVAWEGDLSCTQEDSDAASARQRMTYQGVSLMGWELEHWERVVDGERGGGCEWGWVGGSAWWEVRFDGRMC